MHITQARLGSTSLGSVLPRDIRKIICGHYMHVTQFETLIRGVRDLELG